MVKRKVNRRTKCWLIATILFSIIYLVWRMTSTIPIGFGIGSFIFGMILLLTEIFGMIEQFVHLHNLYEIYEVPAPIIKREDYPEVDVFIPTYNEPEELLRKTINGCLAMEYPDRKKVHIYLCDDSARPNIKALAQRMGISYLAREEHVGAKAGNLNYALAHSSSPLIATFDADMIPKHDFLMVMAAYFVDAKEKGIPLGFVQSPQSFYNPDLFQFNLFSESLIPNEQDYFYRDIEVSKNKSNSVIYGGSNTVLSRQALLDIGGFYTETITEDFATGMLIQKAGYICYAIKDVLASGLSPDDFKSLLSQRIRWARGCIATGKKMKILRSRDLTVAQKLNYMIAIVYWYSPLKRLCYIGMPILASILSYRIIDCTFLEIVLFYLPVCFSSRKAIHLLSNQVRTTTWTNVYETAMFPFMLFPVLFETIGIKVKKFKVTDKSKNEKDKLSIFYYLPHGLLLLLSGISLFRMIGALFTSGQLDTLVNTFWLLSNTMVLILSLFFLHGRDMVRKEERVRAEESYELKGANDTFCGKTYDLSESAVSLLSQEELPMDVITVKIYTQYNEAEVRAEFLYRQEMSDTTKYVYRIIDYIGEETEYYHILYNRVPAFPQQVDEAYGLFDSLQLNFRQHLNVGRKYHKNS